MMSVRVVLLSVEGFCLSFKHCGKAFMRKGLITDSIAASKWGIIRLQSNYRHFTLSDILHNPFDVIFL